MSTQQEQTRWSKDGYGGARDASSSRQQNDSGGAAAHVQDGLSALADKAKSDAAEAIEPFKAKAREIAQREKDAFATRLEGIAGAIDSAAGGLVQESPTTADLLRAAAGSMKQASGSLRNQPVDDLADRARNFARNRPVMLFAGAVIAGLAASRFLKSSQPQHNSQAQRGGSIGDERFAP